MTPVDDAREPLVEKGKVRGEPIGEYGTFTVDGLPKGRDLFWRVAIMRGRPGHIERSVYQRAKPGEPWQEFGADSAGDPSSRRPEPIIWPMWAPGLLDIKISAATPLTNIQDYWSKTGNRLRDSAKWMATVLGLALGALVGTSPLAEMRKSPPHTPAIITGAAGLILLCVTLFLLLQVMRPQSVSFDEIQRGGSLRANRFGQPLRQWKDTIESQQDLYLPCGVKCLTSLRRGLLGTALIIGAFTWR